MAQVEDIPGQTTRASLDLYSRIRRVRRGTQALHRMVELHEGVANPISRAASRLHADVKLLYRWEKIIFNDLHKRGNGAAVEQARGDVDREVENAYGKDFRGE